MDRFPPVVPVRFTPGMTVSDLVAALEKTGAFNGGRLAQACRLFEKMVTDNTTVGLTIAGAMTPAGMGGGIATLIEKGFVDFIVSTGANLFHDMHFALDLPVCQGNPHADDTALREQGIERIYDVYVTDDSLFTTDFFIREVIWALAKEHSDPIPTTTLHHEIGLKLLDAAPRPQDSFVAQAARYGVPIFVSSPGDSSIGMDVAEEKALGCSLTIDPDLDVLQSSAIVWKAERNGVLVLGGGSPKNFYLQTQPMIQWLLDDLKGPGHDYFIQVTTDAPHWGGLSGATPSEAVSWGKIDPTKQGKNYVVVYSDATVGFPILLAHILSAAEPRQPKRLTEKLEEWTADLCEAAKAARPRTEEEAKKKGWIRKW